MIPAVIEKVSDAMTRKSGDLPGSSVLTAWRRLKTDYIYCGQKTGDGLCCLLFNSAHSIRDQRYFLQFTNLPNVRQTYCH